MVTIMAVFNYKIERKIKASCNKSVFFHGSDERGDTSYGKSESPSPAGTGRISVWNAWKQEHSHTIMDLSKANLSRANLSKIDLSGARLYRIRMSESLLYRANLKECRLNQAWLRMADLSETDLSGAYLNAANISNAYFDETNLG